MDAGNPGADGVLGRMMKELTAPERALPFKSATYSMVGNQKFLEGGGVVSPDVVGRNGIQRYHQYESVKDGFDRILKQDSGSLFSQTFSEVLQSNLDKTEHMGALVENVTATSNYTVRPGLSSQLDQVAKMMKLDTTVLENERAAFITSKGGFDTHFEPDMGPLFEDINDSLEQFVNELKAQDLWNNVTIMCVSDFGRTITSNSQGTDHSWGGNYWILGGDIKGSQIFGQYPKRLVDEFSDEVFGSRVLPTTPWEAIWNGIAGWLDVQNTSLPTVLPNAGNFGEEGLFSRHKMFHT